MFCSKCGKEINNEAVFCEQCGCQVKQEVVVEEHKEASPVLESNGTQSKPCAKKSYIASVISAVVSFIIRVSIQENYIYHDNLLDNTKVLGIDREIKPLLTLIPGIAAVIVALVVSADKITDTQKKIRILIINAIYIVLAVVLLWLDIPSDIIDF